MRFLVVVLPAVMHSGSHGDIGFCFCLDLGRAVDKRYRKVVAPTREVHVLITKDLFNRNSTMFEVGAEVFHNVGVPSIYQGDPQVKAFEHMSVADCLSFISMPCVKYNARQNIANGHAVFKNIFRGILLLLRNALVQYNRQSKIDSQPKIRM